MFELVYDNIDAIAPIFPFSLLLIFKKIPVKGKIFLNSFFSISILGYGAADFISIYQNYQGSNLLFYQFLPLFFSIALYFFFRKNFKVKKSKTILLFALIAHFLLYIIKWKAALDELQLETFFYVSFAIFVCIGCFLYFFEVARYIENEPIWMTNEFWIMVILLFYSFLSGLIWGAYKYVIIIGKTQNVSLHDLYDSQTLWTLHNIIYALSCFTLTGILLWKYFKKTST